MKAAAIKLPEAVEMETLYGSADHFITYTDSGNKKPSIWNTVVYFGGRYELTMQAKIQIDYSTETATVVDGPDFFLGEVESVTVPNPPSPGGGGVAASYSRDLKFTGKEWKKVYEAGGKYDVIGFDLDPSPVPEFEVHVHASRAPRPRVSLK